MGKNNTINKKKRFYVVFIGACTGVFSNWEECSKYVLGYSCSLYKSFESEEEAKFMYRAHTEGRLNAVDISSMSARGLSCDFGRKKKRRFYVVFRGTQTGIYNSWEECAPHVIGYSHCLFRSFESAEEAIAQYNQYFGGVPQTNCTSSSIVPTGEIVHWTKRMCYKMAFICCVVGFACWLTIVMST